jgi:hypothetical protein
MLICAKSASFRIDLHCVCLYTGALSTIRASRRTSVPLHRLSRLAWIDITSCEQQNKDSAQLQRSNNNQGNKRTAATQLTCVCVKHRSVPSILLQIHAQVQILKSSNNLSTIHHLELIPNPPIMQPKRMHWMPSRAHRGRSIT